MDMQDDELVDLLDDAVPTGKPPDTGAWKILIVDDDIDVHTATELALRNEVIEGRRLTMLHAYSAGQALEILRESRDMAVVLLDVVMESPDAGLKLARTIREQLDLQELRIILRTGQPGYAPEIATLRNYDINDYRTKTELTRERLYACLMTALRTFRLLMDVIEQKNELDRLHRAEAEALREHLRLSLALREANEGIERSVEDKTRELSKAIAELNVFNGIVAHDLSGPLHGMASLTNLMEEKLDAGQIEQVKRWLTLMQQQCQRLGQLVSDLLQLSRASSGPLEAGPCDLTEIARSAIQTLSLSYPQHLIDAIELETLPIAKVDKGLMSQVFINLLSNALKFCVTPASPHVKVQATAGGGVLQIVVEDNGVGFDEHKAAELFKPFSRLHGSRFAGHGIGLTIVQRIVERHGGTVQAQGRPGQGARFVIQLAQPDSLSVG